ncbi:MAG: PIG-L family deacetylase [Fimbriimonadaceae bacterium]|nr:PIG-L family deacetylase [Fimbriimonadaceae bacterium]
MSTPSTESDKAARKRRNRRRRLWVYGSLLGAFWAFWVWQPWEFDLFPRAAPSPNPAIDPDFAAMEAPEARVLIVTAHPDDEEFYLGGLLARLHDGGADIQLVAMTDGDKGYYWFQDASANRRIRRAEQTEASAQTSVHTPVFLGFQDGRLRAGDREVAALRAQIRAYRPRWVLAFDSLYPPRFSHRDHRRAGAIAEEAVKGTGTQWLMRFSTRAPNFVVDVTDQWEEHKRLVAIHKSQFYGERLERVTNLIESNLEDDGARIGTLLGVGFRCSKLDSQPHDQRQTTNDP